MSWVMFAHNHNLQKDLRAFEVALHEARAERDAALRKLTTAEYHKENWKTHFNAKDEVLKKAMAIIDENLGAENNPLRQQAYKDPDAFRMPKGPRVGQVVTKADHIFLTAIRDRFNERYAHKWKFCKDWLKFANEHVL